MKITLEKGDFGWDFLIRAEDGRNILIQTDWDYPGVASHFGWQACHDNTDGTVDCSVCGNTAHKMIREAWAYLYAHIGDECEDPGYFMEAV